jgi:hypothetical protein
MRTLTAAFVALVLAGSVLALGPRAMSQGSGSTTLTGCLESSEGKFTLTKAQGADAVKDKRIALTPAETVDLKAHVGHTVDVTGELTETDKPEPQMKVTAFKHVSASCG